MTWIINRRISTLLKTALEHKNRNCEKARRWLDATYLSDCRFFPLRKEIRGWKDQASVLASMAVQQSGDKQIRVRKGTIKLKKKQARNQKDFKMPFLNLNTNLSKEKVTAETMNKLAQEMSIILGKDTKWINWMLSTDKLMSRVSFTS